jgi:hypothetical protein
VAKKTVERIREKVSRLYEQGAREGCIEAYLLYWGRRVQSGAGALTNATDGCANLLLLLIGYWNDALLFEFSPLCAG